MNTALDHLVVAAASLEQGVAWCEATLGVTPGPGGRHALMGTHNRLLRIDGPAFPRAYLEILAIDPDAPAPGRPRWFGLDEPALQASLRAAPRLLHLVLRTDGLEPARQGLVERGEDPGEALALERQTPGGRLSWSILVRPDGAIGAAGALPTLIQWDATHPTDAMVRAPLQLRSVAVGGLARPVRQWLQTPGVDWNDAAQAPALAVTLATPLGERRLSSGV